jgi:hypothetical protein
MKWVLPVVIVELAVFGAAEPEVFDFGDLAQYNPKQVGYLAIY